MTILVLSRFTSLLRDRLLNGSPDARDVRWIFADSLRALPEDLTDVDVAVAFSLPPSLYARLPRLAWVACPGAGVDGVLSPALPAHVIVTRMVGPYGRSIAEYVLAAICADAQQHAHAAALQSAHRWESYTPRDVAGRTAAILGAGAIGGDVARLLGAVGMRVIGLRRSGGSDPAYAAMHDLAHLDDFLRAADTLVILTPLTAETRGLVGARELALLPSDALLINVARGPIVDEAALVDALASGRLRAAALDVFVTEPLPEEHALWDAPGVRLTPHVAGLSHVGDVAEYFLANLARYRAGEPLAHVVDRTRGY